MLIPDRLIETHIRDPLAVGVYVAVARLALIRKGPVPLSASELAIWMGSETEVDRVALMRRIIKLERGGWLLVSRETAYKHTLLPTWGEDRSGLSRPWDFAQAATGRPEHLRGRRVPLQLLDTTLGQLKPQLGRAPAIINRYLTHPLLDLADIGTFTIRLRTLVPPTARLMHLGLTTETLPPQRALLKLAADGVLTTLIGDIPTRVSLTAWGYDHLGIMPPMLTSTSDEQVCRSLSRSPELGDQEPDIALPGALKRPALDANAHNAWHVGIKESSNSESPPNMFDSVGGGAPDLVHNGETTTGRPAHRQPTTAIPGQLSPQIIAAHQALNRGYVALQDLP